MTWPNVPTIIPATPAHGSNMRGGVDPPRYFSSGYYQTDVGYFDGVLVATTVIGGIHYEPFYVWTPQQFSGMSVVNTSTSENGKVAMLGLFNDDSSSGGPGTLQHTFGQITFGTVSAITTALNTVTLGRGRYWGAAWFASQCGMYRLSPFSIAAGNINLTAADLPVMTAQSPQPQGLYATTTYATAFPATAVAPTGILSTTSAALSALAMYLYV